MKYYYYPSNYVRRGRGRGGSLFRKATKPVDPRTAPLSIQKKIIKAEKTGKPVALPKKELSLWQKAKNFAKGIGKLALKAIPVALAGVGAYAAYKNPTGMIDTAKRWAKKIKYRNYQFPRVPETLMLGPGRPAGYLTYVPEESYPLVPWTGKS